MGDQPTLTERFVDWSTRLEAVPDDVRTAARWHVLDALGTGLAAARLGPVDFAVAEAMNYGTRAEASIRGHGTRRELAAKVFVQRRPFDGSLGEAPGDVRVTLDDGATLARTMTSSSATPGRPIDEGALLDKFLSNVAGSVEGAEGMAKLVIEDGGLPVRELMSMTSRR